MLHDDVESIIPQLVLPHGNFLQPDVILEHLSEVDCDTLADGLVDGVLDVELLQCIITRVEHGENTDDTVMINLVIAQVEGE